VAPSDKTYPSPLSLELWSLPPSTCAPAPPQLSAHLFLSQPRACLLSLAAVYPGSFLQQRSPPLTTSHISSSQALQPAQQQPFHTFSRLYTTMDIPLWPGKAARWPGSHLPRHQWPRGMHLDEAGNPIYPPGVTCKQLGEEPPYFPVTPLFWIFAVLSTLLYLVWPAYVMWRFLRTVC
jgi:hypothetical protein